MLTLALVFALLGRVTRSQRGASRRAVAVLAFCGRRLGGCLHRGVRSRQVGGKEIVMESHSEGDQPQTRCSAACSHRMADGAGPRPEPGRRRHGDKRRHQPARTGADGCSPASAGSAQVLPIEHHESVAVQAQAMPVISARAGVARLAISPMHRKMLPVETYKITAGIKGGIAGGVAMSIPAMLYGLIKYHSIWYAINLLAAGGFVSWAGREQRVSCGVSSARVSGGARDPRRHLAAGRTSLWRDAPDVPQMADPYLRVHRAFVVDRTGLQRPRHCQSDPGSAHRLALVHHLAMRVRTGCRFRSQSGCQSTHSSVPGAALRGPRGIAYRSWRISPRRKTIPNERGPDLCVGLLSTLVWDVLAVMRPGIRRRALKFRVRNK